MVTTRTVARKPHSPHHVGAETVRATEERTPASFSYRCTTERRCTVGAHCDSAEECLKSEVQLNEAGCVLSEASGPWKREPVALEHLVLARSAVLSTVPRK